MSGFFAHAFIVIPLIGLCAFGISYLWAERVLSFFHQRSLGQRTEVMQTLDKMFVEVNEKQITWIMLLSSFGLGFLFFILLWPHAVIGLIFGSAITVVGWSIPKFLVNALYEQRCGRFVNQMVDGLTIMANGIRSGLSIAQSMERVVENMPNPISQEFGLVLSQVRIGRSLEEALIELGERIPKPDVQMFVTAINVLKETGGNLGETFSTIVVTIRERQKVEKKIEALTAQGLMQGIIITLVPFLLLLIFEIIDPAYVRPLFTTSVGIIALLIMLILQIIGGLMIRKIVKINV